jgi:hypothetical protein
MQGMMHIQVGRTYPGHQRLFQLGLHFLIDSPFLTTAEQQEPPPILQGKTPLCIAKTIAIPDGGGQGITFGKIKTDPHYAGKAGMFLNKPHGMLEARHIYQERSAGHKKSLKAPENSRIDDVAIPEVIGVDDNLISSAHTGYRSGSELHAKNALCGEIFQQLVKNISIST